MITRQRTDGFIVPRQRTALAHAESHSLHARESMAQFSRVQVSALAVARALASACVSTNVVLTCMHV
eukprot:35884-Pleurochrysis_carterae.AAC.1